MTQHFPDKLVKGITRRKVAHVLNNWLVRGITPDPLDPQTKSWRYYGFAPGLKYMLRVAVSLDDKRLVTVFPDRNATKAWRRGNLSYFARHHSDLEARRGTERTLR